MQTSSVLCHIKLWHPSTAGHNCAVLLGEASQQFKRKSDFFSVHIHLLQGDCTIIAAVFL